MNQPLKRFVAFLLPAVLLFPGSLVAAAPLKKHRAAFTAFAYANPPFWIAKDLRVFEKYGLDVELIYVGGARNIQALISGSIDFSQVGGASVVSAAAQGAEVVILGTVFRRLIFGVHAAPQIKDLSDLKGKNMAVGTVGGNSYFAGLLFLSRVGLVPNKDVTFRAVSGTPEVLSALQHGQVQAGVMSPPSTSIAARMGFRQIFDIAGLDLPFPTISVASTRRFVQENPETILNVLRATAEAIYLYKTQPELTLPVVAKYIRVPKDDPALRESYETYGKQLDQNLRPSPEGIKFILDFLADQRLALKSKNAADFMDLRFVSKLEEEGFFKKVATK
jgi:ABC-type nitrate/sulfonate/bicarbonate transport system substrate-binding protein